MRRVLAATAVSAVIIISGAVIAQASHVPPPTSVTSWREHDRQSAGTTLIDVVTVTPALGRAVELQERVDGRWVTRATMRLAHGYTAQLDVRLTHQWTTRPVTWWRLHVPATETAAAVTSAVKRVEVSWEASDDPASFQVLVNKERPLDPVDWAPSALLRPDVAAVGRHDQLRPVAARALERLTARAHDATGEQLVLVSGYRPYGYQHELHARYLHEHGAAEAETFSARAGHSEHQTGLAADVTQAGVPFTDFGTTSLARWVAGHAWEHGFVVRYPEGAERLTGYAAEPWHLRYVGKDLAAYLHRGGVATLEEAFGTGPAPDYAPR